MEYKASKLRKQLNGVGGSDWIYLMEVVERLCKAVNLCNSRKDMKAPIKLESSGNQIIVTLGMSTKERKRAERKALREEWIANWSDAFEANDEAWIKRRDGSNITVSVHSGYNTIVTSTATCNSSDTFDFGVGVAVAYARACGEKIPHYI